MVNRNRQESDNQTGKCEHWKLSDSCQDKLMPMYFKVTEGLKARESCF